jgi:hypothetical protein
VLELPTHGSEGSLDILERLDGLKAKIAAELTISVHPELAGDVDKPGRGRRLHHLGVAWRLRECLRIDETRSAHGMLLVSEFAPEPAHEAYQFACTGRHGIRCAHARSTV